jgi:hypothetical protein
VSVGNVMNSVLLTTKKKHCNEHGQSDEACIVMVVGMNTEVI